MILDCQNICKSFGTDVILNTSDLSGVFSQAVIEKQAAAAKRHTIFCFMIVSSFHLMI